MAFSPPTVDDFLERYPEFEETDEDRIDAVLEWATSEVGPTWIDKDREPAILALVAATLTDETASSFTSAVTGNAVSGPATSETVGPLSIRYQTGQQSGRGTTGNAAATELSAYRLFFNMLRRRSFPPVGII